MLTRLYEQALADSDKSECVIIQLDTAKRLGQWQASVQFQNPVNIPLFLFLQEQTHRGPERRSPDCWAFVARISGVRFARNTPHGISFNVDTSYMGSNVNDEHILEALELCKAAADFMTQE